MLLVNMQNSKDSLHSRNVKSNIKVLGIFFETILYVEKQGGRSETWIYKKESFIKDILPS